MRVQGSFWRAVSDEVLAPLFADGRKPTLQEIREAYPFGPRRMWPYKVWLEQVRWWRAGCPEPGPVRRHPAAALAGQEALL